MTNFTLTSSQLLSLVEITEKMIIEANHENWELIGKLDAERLLILHIDNSDHPKDINVVNCIDNNDIKSKLIKADKALRDTVEKKHFEHIQNGKMYHAKQNASKSYNSTYT